MTRTTNLSIIFILIILLFSCKEESSTSPQSNNGNGTTPDDFTYYISFQVVCENNIPIICGVNIYANDSAIITHGGTTSEGWFFGFSYKVKSSDVIRIELYHPLTKEIFYYSSQITLDSSPQFFAIEQSDAGVDGGKIYLSSCPY